MRQATYSDAEINQITRYYRKSLIPSPLRTLDDLKQYPNDVLLSHLLSDHPHSREKLTDLFRDLNQLRHVLQQATQTLCSNPPLLHDGIAYTDPDEPVRAIAHSIAGRTEKYAKGYDQDKILIATPTPQRHTYPSPNQFSLDFYALTEEKTANIPIFDLAFSDQQSKNMYVRENSILVLLSLLDLQSDTERLKPFKKQIPTFEEHARGIVLAHEFSELKLADTLESSQLEAMGGERKELLAEENAYQFLIRQGVDPQQYRLFHTLRAGTDDHRGRNISRVVLETVTP